MENLSSANPNLTKDTENFLKEMSNLPTPDDDSPQAKREHLEKIQSLVKYDMPAAIEDIIIKVKPYGDVPIRIVRPFGNTDVLPVIFYLHGGGWVTGSKNTHDRLIRTLANCTDSVVVFPEYTLSPEAKFPQALKESFAAIKYVTENAEKFKINPDSIAIAGDSAGGNMATVLAMMIKINQTPKLKFQALFYPATDMRLETDSARLFSDGPLLTLESMKYFKTAYLANCEETTNIYASPVLATQEDLRDLPPALIIVAENDMLKNDGENYAKKLDEAGVPVACVSYSGTVHDFMMLNGLKHTQPTIHAIEQACCVLRKALHEE